MTDPKAMEAARRIMSGCEDKLDAVTVARALLAGEGPVPPPALEQFSKIEGYGFQCEGGPLENCQDWHGLKSQVTAAIAGIEKTISEFNISGKPDGYVCRAWLETALNSLKSSPFPTVRDGTEGDPICQCPKCGRMHRDLQAGKPPMAIAGPSLLRPAETLKAVPLTAPHTIAVRDVTLREALEPLNEQLLNLARHLVANPKPLESPTQVRQLCREFLKAAAPAVRDARLDQWEDAEDGRHAARTEANEEPAVRDVTLREALEPLNEQLLNLARHLVANPKPLESPTQVRQLCREFLKAIERLRAERPAVEKMADAMEELIALAETTFPASDLLDARIALDEWRALHPSVAETGGEKS